MNTDDMSSGGSITADHFVRVSVGGSRLRRQGMAVCSVPNRKGRPH